ncbi:MAG: class I adenylate-forming enzyme family protein, partial [Planctomycetaceae bacterium]
MNTFSSILERKNGLDDPAILGREPYSYRELISLATEFADTLRPILKNTSRPLICAVLPASPIQIAAFLAAYILDAVLTPVNPQSSTQEIKHIIDETEATIVISTPTMPLPNQIRLAPASQWNGIEIRRISDRSHAFLESGDRLIIFTSGSTSKPKGVVLTDQSLTRNFRSVAEFLELSPEDKTCVFTPPA